MCKANAPAIAVICSLICLLILVCLLTLLGAYICTLAGSMSRRLFFVVLIELAHDSNSGGLETTVLPVPTLASTV